MLGSVYILFLISLIYNPLIYTVAWAAIFLMVNLAIALSVPGRFYNRSSLVHLLKLPQGFLLMLLSALRFKSALKAFNPTPKTGSSEQQYKSEKP
ncbi:MAG: hypothetical protein U5Q03_03830 [Bacteroidota bacterium]|nr:hypothetical protein [Bacteroidota bacterium]